MINIAKNNDKSKWSCSGYGIAFDGKSYWNFGNDSARNVVIFGVENSSLSHTDNCKNDFLLLDEGDGFDINKSLVLIFVTQGQNFA